MRIAILSDVHGNLTALEAVLADLEQQRPDLVAHGGDLVTRGARPAQLLGLERVPWLRQYTATSTGPASATLGDSPSPIAAASARPTTSTWRRSSPPIRCAVR
jgi:3',5'-cyclic AMP phosphodiesterase CpdA